MTTTEGRDSIRSGSIGSGGGPAEPDRTRGLREVVDLVGHEDADGRHLVADNCPAEFTWDYTKGARPKLDRLYEKAKRAQWNGRTDLPWETPVDPERLAMAGADVGRDPRWAGADLGGTALEHWGDREWLRFRVEQENWMLSQFMHGEQGALICTAKIVETVPWIDAKYYAATQVVDEARHVEVFSRYLDEKLSGHYPVNAHLGLLLDEIVADSRWDMTYLGMQIMVEGLALAAFGFMYQLTQEPLLKTMLRYVMADEARHVAFGVLSLQEHYAQLTTAEIRDRQEFAFEAAVRMRDRLLMQEVWERMEVPKDDVVRVVSQSPERDDFQILLFSKIVPNVKKLGLLDAAGGWLRDRFTDLGVIAFEDWTDTEAELDAAAEGSPVARQVV
ncbi:MAG TPA: ferritin-like domain-containing protein [Acidimicrobiales bacterium]|nr:ferritin-like domain-containing protein [Acidimicrobiales bacterium]